MAKRRMTSTQITDSDEFLDMPLSTQALYYHLNQRADDEGFLNNAKRIMRMIGAAEDDMKILIGKRFIIPFESGVIVIKHWKINNVLRKDRLTETVYQDEKSLLTTKENGTYTLGDSDVDISTMQPNDNQMTTKCLPNDRITNSNLTNSNITNNKIYSPAEQDIVSYLNDKTNSHYKPTTPKTQSLIRARLDEGFTIDDFKTVIDNKCADWLNDAKMKQYLRPVTLFGTKFESYLNQKKSTGNAFLDLLEEGEL
jgi:uncharacterized phage protein (TIGR02220 family)